MKSRSIIVEWLLLILCFSLIGLVIVKGAEELKPLPHSQLPAKYLQDSITEKEQDLPQLKTNQNHQRYGASVDASEDLGKDNPFLR